VSESKQRCLECGSQRVGQLHRQLNLGGYGNLRLVILACADCEWTTIVDWDREPWDRRAGEEQDETANTR
jgi:hypothetical protein